MPEKPSHQTLAGRAADYVRRDARADAMAGLSVAVMGVPQAMAYALIAGLPPVYGLYTAIATCAVSALLGSSNHLVTGPTNAACMVILSLTADLPARTGHGLLEIVFLLTFITGLIQLVFGVLKLGGIVRYVSNSVIIGFTAGAGILIAVNQLRNVLGVDISADGARRFHEVLVATVSRVGETNVYALVLAAGTALLVAGLPKISKRLPASLIAVGAATFACWALGWYDATTMGAHRVEIARDIEPIRGSLAIFHVPSLVVAPDWALALELTPGALALAVIGLIEATAIARTIASKTGQRLDFTQEFIGQGAGKMAGAFFSSFAGSGSFTRSAVCYQSGGRTRMAAIFSAGWTALTLLLFAPFANFIPKASLAGMLLVIAYSMIDKQRLKSSLKSGRFPQIVLFGTLLSTLVVPIQYAIFVGVALSVLILLRVTGQTDLTQLVRRPDEGFDEVPFNKAPASAVAVVNMEGDLYFAAAEDLDYELLRCITPQTRVVVLRMKRLRAVGSTAMAILEHYWELLRERDIRLVVCGIEDELKDVMTGSGLRRKIGEENIFYADNKLLQSTELALARARSICDVERRNAETVVLDGADAPAVPRGITAADVMDRRCIRFGNQHQLREAVWLMSEMHRQSRSTRAQPLFLQHRDGTLAAKLTPWRVLREFASRLDPDAVHELDDRTLGARFREHFTTSIASIADGDPAAVTKATGLARAIQIGRDDDVDVIPVVSEDGHITGLIHMADALRALARSVTPPEDADA